MAYRLTLQAQREREDALEYQAREWGDRAAEELAAAFRTVLEQIGGWSPPGAMREQFAGKRYRWVHLAPYPYNIVWAYGAAAEDRVIVRILHAHMEPIRAMRKTERWS
ncbi:MAG TPA: type II toxin-antitoxin system RelE/ParE family toxin [Candidatus Binatia bacterium]|nr:type II toxin-antitoxin system RelE/ParE family toxin [Candidatus Binatia bacterium]